MKIGKNDFMIDISMLQIPDWWLEEQGNPSVRFNPRDIRWLDFCSMIYDVPGSVSDTLKIQAVDVLVK